MKKKIDIASIPELSTSVGMHGSMKQKEVGGPLCLGVAGRHPLRSLRSRYRLERRRRARCASAFFLAKRDL